MKTYVIAGGAGFIGSHLTDALLNEDSHIICVDNLITGSENNISHLFGKKNFTFINKDIITGPPQISGNVDGIFHLASPASPSLKSPKSYMARPIETLMVNSYGTKNLLDLAHSKNCPILFASTSEVYGDPTISPQNEDYFGNVNPNGPRSVYDEGKRFGESMCMTYFRLYNVDVRIARIFNTYGPRMQRDDGRVVSNFINQALHDESLTVYGDGRQTRSFCFVDDLVRGLLSFLNADSLSSRVINLGNDDEHEIIEIAKIVKKLTSSQSKIIHEDLPPDDPHQRRPDLSRAKKSLNYHPEVPLEDGLRKTIEYFKHL